MRDDEILYKAIMKAEKNGYRGHLDYLPLHMSFVNGEAKKRFTKKKFKDFMSRIWHAHLEEIVFSHEFAKAFWPRQNKTCLLSSRMGMSCKHEMCDTAEYKLQLTYMVAEKDRIKYLEKFL